LKLEEIGFSNWGAGKACEGVRDGGGRRVREVPGDFYRGLGWKDLESRLFRLPGLGRSGFEKGRKDVDRNREDGCRILVARNLNEGLKVSEL
jgi:hypothetical protein